MNIATVIFKHLMKEFNVYGENDLKQMQAGEENHSINSES